MCTSLLKTLNIEYASNPCVERVLALGGGVILYSKGFQPYFQQSLPLLRERIEHSMRSIVSVLGEGSILIKNNIFNSSYELFFFLIYEARKKKSPKRKKKHVLSILASSVLTELGTFTSPLGEVAVVLAEQATNNQTSPLLRERIEHSMRSIASVLGEGLALKSNKVKTPKLPLAPCGRGQNFLATAELRNSGEGTNQTIAILRALPSERRKSGGKLWYQ